MFCVLGEGKLHEPLTLVATAVTIVVAKKKKQLNKATEAYSLNFMQCFLKTIEYLHL